jgi:hypothetical protein
MTAADERIWYEDFRGFLRADRLLMFVPLPNTSIESQINACVRFMLYLSVIIALYRWALRPAVVLLAVTAAVSWLLYTTESRATSERLAMMDRSGVQIDPGTRAPCTRPTASNPFMNVLLTDYDRFPERPRACDITREAVKARAESLSSRDLYADVDDVYGRRVNQSRSFYTNPGTTIPNDQGGFARWLYQPSGGPRGTCREGNGDACAAFALGP